MLYREIIAVCSEIRVKHINTLCGQNVGFLDVKSGGKYSNHWALKVLCSQMRLFTDVASFCCKLLVCQLFSHCRNLQIVFSYLSNFLSVQPKSYMNVQAIYINKYPTRCNGMPSVLFYCKWPGRN
jgi:hypothetical protein